MKELLALLQERSFQPTNKSLERDIVSAIHEALGVVSSTSEDFHLHIYLAIQTRQILHAHTEYLPVTQHIPEVHVVAVQALVESKTRPVVHVWVAMVEHFGAAKRV